MLFLCFELRTCQLIGKLSIRHSCFEIILVFGPLFVLILIKVRGFIFFILRVLIVVLGLLSFIILLASSIISLIFFSLMTLVFIIAFKSFMTFIFFQQFCPIYLIQKPPWTQSHHLTFSFLLDQHRKMVFQHSDCLPI